MEHNHSKHMWLMVVACIGALLLLLVLPLIGLSKNWSVGISIAVMVGLHLLMMKGHLGKNHKEVK
jgi:low affinity Fe/Cu permease